MRFSYQVGMSDADHYLPLAKAAEAAANEKADDLATAARTATALLVTILS